MGDPTVTYCPACGECIEHRTGEDGLSLHECVDYDNSNGRSFDERLAQGFRMLDGFGD